MEKAEEVIRARGSVYGNFWDDATICQDLKEVLHEQGGWQKLAPDQKQSLELIMVKVARILNGDPDYLDNWVDIEGYAMLVSRRLKEDRAAAVASTAKVELIAQTHKCESTSTQVE